MTENHSQSDDHSTSFVLYINMKLNEKIPQTVLKNHMIYSVKEL